MKRMIFALIAANFAATACFAFNPQPDPPGKVFLNPQPEPPGISAMSNPQTLTLGSQVSLNPQPLPPRLNNLLTH